MPEGRHWIFQANPKLFNLLTDTPNLSVGEQDEWAVKQFRNEMQPGDQVAIWHSGPGGGIVAFGRLITPPAKRSELFDYEKKEGKIREPEYSVFYEFTHIFPEGLPRESLKLDPRLQGLSILKFAQATNFRVTPGEWAVLEEHVGHLEGAALSLEEQAWTEGRPRLALHLKRERAPHAAQAKKAQCREKNGGRLICEACGLDPAEQYGDAGEACIEVHHLVPLGGSKGESKTLLNDLQCLCANCHRVAHHRLRVQERAGT